MYQKARNGEIKNFTELDALFKVPKTPFLEMKSLEMTLEESVNKYIKAILPQL